MIIIGYTEQEIRLFIEESLLKHDLIATPLIELSTKYPDRLAVESTEPELL